MSRPSLRSQAALILAGLLLAACSSIGLESKKVDYKSTGKLPPLEVPPDLTRPSADDRYAVPDINPRGTATYSEYARDRSGASGRSNVASLVLPTTRNVRVERDGNQRWLVVTGTPDEVWPVVKQFWQETGFIVNIEIPEAGVMETDWAENRATLSDPGVIRKLLGRFSPYSTSERDKFRTRLERGVTPGTTEIYISHRGMVEVYAAGGGPVDDNILETVWQPRPPDPTLEAEMLGRLMTRFGVESERARRQVASAPNVAPRARLIKGPEGETLALNEQFDRAWRRVGLALDRVGFTVEDRDRSKGLYYVRYIDPQIDVQAKKETGWLSKLKFWGSEPPKAEKYRILVTDKQAGSLVNVLNTKGTHEESDTSNRILTLLYNQLK